MLNNLFRANPNNGYVLILKNAKVNGIMGVTVEGCSSK